MSEQQTEEVVAGTPQEEASLIVEPETGRPRSSSVIGGLRSPLDELASQRAGTLRPRIQTANEGRTGKKLSQWGASSRRRSYWKSQYYEAPD